MVTVSVSGVASTSEGGFAVLLSEGSRVLPIFVGPGQAQAIQMGVSDQTPPRPMTHDLMVEVVNEVGGAMDRLVVDDLQEGTYYGKLYVEFYGEERSETVFDVRPSDGVALMVRTGGKIEVDDDLMEENGIDEEELDIVD